MNTAQSNAAGDRRERRFTLKLLTQIGIIFGICWISTCIERVLPFTLPASIIGMLLLLALLLARVIKTEHIREKSDYLLGNLPFFFIPASVSIINYADVLRENLLALVVVCAVSLIATFAATVGAVRLTCRLLEQFLQAGYIRETKVEGRKRSYVLTPIGREALEAEARRLRQLTADYERLMESEGGAP